MGISLALHLVGMVMWVGGLMFLTRLLKVLSSNPAALPALAPALKRMYFGFVMGGLVLSTVTGVLQVVLGGVGNYMAQGAWFHPKLTLVLVLYVLSFVLLKQIKAVEQGQTPNGGRAMMLHGISGLVLIVISVLMEVVR